MDLWPTQIKFPSSWVNFCKYPLCCIQTWILYTIKIAGSRSYHRRISGSTCRPNPSWHGGCGYPFQSNPGLDDGLSQCWKKSKLLFQQLEGRNVASKGIDRRIQRSWSYYTLRATAHTEGKDGTGLLVLCLATIVVSLNGSYRVVW